MEILAQIPPGAMLVFTGHDPRGTKHGACGNILQQSHILMTNGQEADFMRFSCQRLPATNARP